MVIDGALIKKLRPLHNEYFYRNPEKGTEGL